MNPKYQVCWGNIKDLLNQYHESKHPKDPILIQDVCKFIEEEFRLCAPHHFFKTQEEHLQVDDIIQELLIKMIHNPLLNDVDHPKAYLMKVFRNQCIDAGRRSRKKEIKNELDYIEHVDTERNSPESAMIDQESVEQYKRSMAQLSIKDRIALKLYYAVEWLTDDEIEWLAQQSNIKPHEIRKRLSYTVDKYDLTKLFDPGDDDEDDKELRRRRMERFRRRVDRARLQLKQKLTEY